jgi:hypothetical protein
MLALRRPVNEYLMRMRRLLGRRAAPSPNQDGRLAASVARHPSHSHQEHRHGSLTTLSLHTCPQDLAAGRQAAILLTIHADIVCEGQGGGGLSMTIRGQSQPPSCGQGGVTIPPTGRRSPQPALFDPNGISASHNHHSLAGSCGREHDRSLRLVAIPAQISLVETNNRHLT